MSELYELPEGWDTKFFNETVENFDKSRVPIKAMNENQFMVHIHIMVQQVLLKYVDDYIFDGEFLFN